MPLDSDGIIHRPKFLTSVHRPAYDIEFHPRAFNKPLLCQVGRHPILRKIIGPDGIPHLYCPKCGSSVPEGLHTGTWSKQDIDKLSKIKQSRYGRRTKKEIMVDVLRKKEIFKSERSRKEHMEASIAQFVKERFMDQ